MVLMKHKTIRPRLECELWRPKTEAKRSGSRLRGKKKTQQIQRKYILITIGVNKVLSISKINY